MSRHIPRREEEARAGDEREDKTRDRNRVGAHAGTGDRPRQGARDSQTSGADRAAVCLEPRPVLSCSRARVLRVHGVFMACS